MASSIYISLFVLKYFKNLDKLNNFSIELVIFICGSIVMVFEIVGSRILGPYFGTSTFVWSSIIGVILGSLSLGYYLGGKAADKSASKLSLSHIILLSAVFISITVLIKDAFLVFLQTNFLGYSFMPILASLILFSPASVLLGMVSPYAVRLKLVNLKNSGSIIGNLYAVSAIGSVFGTFLAGFYLLPFFGTNQLLIILIFILVIVSLALSPKNLIFLKIFFLVGCTLILTLFKDFNYLSHIFKNSEFKDIDTTYSRIWIYNTVDPKTGTLVKVMGINNENHSSMFLDSDNLVNDYTKYYHLVKHFNPNFKNTLMIGGAGYSFPKNFLLEYPEAEIDVVEIDPKITKLAEKYFNLEASPRLSVYHLDGRVYLNSTDKKYDAIFIDAFSSRNSLPYQLTTSESIQKQHSALNSGGVAIVNMITAIEGDNGVFLRAELATYKKVFPQVYLFPVADPTNGVLLQNVILVALKTNKVPEFNSIDPELNSYLQHLWKRGVSLDLPILTDDYAPVDFYLSKTY